MGHDNWGKNNLANCSLRCMLLKSVMSRRAKLSLPSSRRYLTYAGRGGGRVRRGRMRRTIARTGHHGYASTRPIACSKMDPHMICQHPFCFNLQGAPSSLFVKRNAPNPSVKSEIEEAKTG